MIWRVLYVLFAILLLITRRPDQIIRPQLANEDGLVFWPYSLVWGALLQPYMGYLHAVPRLISALTAPVPIEWQPLVWNLAALTITAVASLRLLLARIPGTAAAFGAVALLAVPSAGDHWASVACLHFVFAAVLLVNLLEPPPATERESTRRSVEIAMGALSGPEGIILAPLAAIRGWQWRKDPLARGPLAIWFSAVAVEFLALISQPRGTFVDPLQALPSLGLMARYTKTLFGLWAGDPFNASFANVFGGAIAGAYLFLFFGRRVPHRWNTVACLSSALLFLICGRLVSQHWPNPLGFASRLMYMPCVLTCWAIGWLICGASIPRQLTGVALLLAMISSGLCAWTADPYPDYRWQQQVAELRQGRRELLFFPGQGTDGLIHPFAQYPPEQIVKNRASSRSADEH